MRGGTKIISGQTCLACHNAIPVFTPARLYINISTYVTTGNREGFERWAKLNNLKEATRTFDYLSENNLLNYEDFQQHVSDVDASVKAAEQRITQINNELNTQKVIQKHCDSYRLCRKVIEDCKSAKNPKAYRTKHQERPKLFGHLFLGSRAGAFRRRKKSFYAK